MTKLLRNVKDDLQALARDVCYRLRKAWPPSWRGPAHGLHLQVGGWSPRNRVPPLEGMGAYVDRLRGEATRTPQWPYEPGLWLVAHSLAEKALKKAPGDPAIYVRNRARSFLLDERRDERNWYTGRTQGTPLRPLSQEHFRHTSDEADRGERHFADVMVGPPDFAGRAGKGQHQVYPLRSDWARSWAADPYTLVPLPLYPVLWWLLKVKDREPVAGGEDPYAGHPQGLGDSNDSNGAPGKCYQAPWATRWLRMVFSRLARGWYTEDRRPAGETDFLVAVLEPGDPVYVHRVPADTLLPGGAPGAAEHWRGACESHLRACAADGRLTMPPPPRSLKEWPIPQLMVPTPDIMPALWSRTDVFGWRGDWAAGWNPADRATLTLSKPAPADDWRQDWIATRESHDVKRWGDTATALRKLGEGPLGSDRGTLRRWRGMPPRNSGGREDARELIRGRYPGMGIKLTAPYRAPVWVPTAARLRGLDGLRRYWGT